MVKLIVTDIDGVIVGHKIGVNFPYPNQKVIQALKQVREKGIPIVLCSGKYQHVIKPIILSAHLNNSHITDSGALIIDPIANRSTAFTLDKDIVSEIIATCLKNNIHVEAYAENDYFVQKGVFEEVTPKRFLILQKDPIEIDSLVEEANKHKIIKLILIAFNEKDKEKINNTFEKYSDKVKFVWTLHPSTKPWEYFLITSPKASKVEAIKTIASELGISLEDTLGIGDTLGDWEFMKECSYVATMEDTSIELRGLVRSKGEGKYVIGPSVNDDGILQILNYFLK